MTESVVHNFTCHILKGLDFLQSQKLCVRNVSSSLFDFLSDNDLPFNVSLLSEPNLSVLLFTLSLFFSYTNCQIALSPS